MRGSAYFGAASFRRWIAPLSCLFISLIFSSVLFADFTPSIFGSYADQRVLLSFLLVFSTTLGLAWLSVKGVLAFSLASLWPFFLALSSFALGLFHVKSQPFVAIEPIFYVLYLLSFGLLGATLRQANFVTAFAQAVTFSAIVTCFFYAAMTISVYLFAISDGYSHLDKIIPWGFVNIRYWSHVATWLMPLFPLGILLAPWKDSRLWRLGVGFAAAIWWWIVFLSSSRGSAVGLVCGLVLVGVVFGKTSWPWVRLFVRFALYGVVVWLLLSFLVPSLVFEELQVRGIKAHDAGRVPLWQEAWAMSLQNFPFGMGPQSWLTHDILEDGYRSSTKFAHPHNMYLLWAAEYGWVSIAGFALLGCYGLSRLLRSASMVGEGCENKRCLLIAFTASVAGALVHAGASAVFIAPGSMLVGLVVLTVFWAMVLPAGKERKLGLIETTGRRVLPPVVGFFVPAAFLIVGGVWFCDVLRYQKATAQDFEYYQGELLLSYRPRFWFHGYYPRHPSQMPPGPNRSEFRD